MTPKPVSIVILNWNGKELLEKFLPSILANSPSHVADIVVADNGSTDGSAERIAHLFPSVRLIALERNYGFAQGYNLALEKIYTPYVVLLNSDVEVTSGWLDAPLSMLDQNPSVAGVQPKIRDWRNRSRFEYAGAAGGFIDRYGYPFCRGRLLHVIETDTGQYNHPTDIFWATGACLFIRTEIYKKEGGLDPSFFAHQEEVDLCWRLRCRGYRLMYTPDSVVYHVGGATLQAENPRKTFLNFRNSLLMLYKNLPEEELSPVMRTRFWLDGLAAVRFLVSGNFRNAVAVCRARLEFHRLRPAYALTRKENMQKVLLSPIPEQLPRSLVWSFYLKGKRKFSDLYPF